MSSVVTRTLAADHITPVRAYAALRVRGAGSSFLLESVLPGERWGRYSIVGYRGRAETVYRAGSDAFGELAKEIATLEEPVVTGTTGSPFAETETLAARFTRALVGFVGYDAASMGNPGDTPPARFPKPLQSPSIGSRPQPPVDGRGEVIARVLRDATIVLFDNLRQTLTIAGATEADVERCAEDLRANVALDPLVAPNPKAYPDDIQIDVSDAEYAARVDRVKEYILAGDAFQVVLARTFSTSTKDADPFDVYRALRVLSPSPYLYFLDFAGTAESPPIAIAGASPETLVRFTGGKITLRPIAGTRKRGVTDEEDARLAAELIADPKERAEHVMLIDLARNDVGRVSRPGSVELTANMVVEKYSHVMHIVSEVTGAPRADVSPNEILRSAFPAGTLSGAPKVRAMQIIRELEGKARGVYGGAVGYVMPDGSLDFAIAIRTVVAREGRFEVTAGAGIVEASVPALEAEETRSKAQAALAAIRSAQDFRAARR